MSGGLRERLERLRAQAAAAKAADEAYIAQAKAETAAEEREGAAAQALARPGAAGLDAASSTGEAAAVAVAREAEKEKAQSELHPSFARLGVEQADNEFGSFLLRRLAYPLASRHGLYELRELLDYAPWLEPVASRQNKGADDLSGLPIEAGRLLFLDTETTGLGVGAGNVPFMIGIGYVEPAEGKLYVEQTLIRHPGEEKAMLHYLLGRMANRTHLVTYNGRSFDWPVLAGRYILNGWRRKGPEPGHLDFLHPSRALWRNTLESCRLSRIEQDRLGIAREEDVPGSLAPELYVKFLSDGDAAHLEGVYLHNERDVLTLVTLATHFGALLAGSGRLGLGEEAAGDGIPEAAEELFRTAAWLDAHGRTDRSERLFEALAARQDEAASRWWLKTALRYKKLGRFEAAVPLWLRAADRAEKAAFPSYEAHVELAMFYEHRAKNASEALRFAERALELALRRPVSAREQARIREEREGLRHRVERLRRKSRGSRT
ncbi:hypothetical protein J19TS2_10670 [Cohnella xylanilytica]|uniref:Ribonuclease H-like domain-containing protein n=1 Tax=Cohnella xylanilytica TaxID=557555 RepID=A0A841TZQ2_9BACL|nr:ribonuclease H-like domain-containing protein [Cohnella xylanilytica]MBB6691144.1 ribonuclease H-like domain-containing protein [Cohnella xylanilytica]GIO11512.1 hypothetical protein J19TS2_10670 [Cohnella xylanilytica]